MRYYLTSLTESQFMNHLSPFQKAINMQNHAAQYRFDWPDLLPVFDKLEEEITELKEAIESQDKKHISAEFGDILFVIANIARHLNLDPEHALEHTNQKFENRFNHVLKSLNITQSEHAHSLETMETAWQKSKTLFP